MKFSSSEQAGGNYFKTIIILSIAVWLVVMNTTMFNVALPSVLSEFSLSPSQGAWIVSGYSIVLAIFTITYTRLADYFPIRRLLSLGILIFGLSSILGFFAENFVLLLIARLCQAVGAAAIPGLSMVFAGRFIPMERRGRAMAMVASASALGFGLGPVVGGAITDRLEWNYLFIVTVFVVLVIPMLFKMMPDEQVRRGAFDIIGGILTGLGVTSFLLFTSTFNWYYLIAGGLFIFLLWQRINRTDLPFIQPELIKNGNYRKILYVTYIVFCMHFALLFLMPLMLQHVYGKNPAVVGLIIFPGAMLSAVAAVFVGRLIDTYGNLKVMILAHLLLITAALIFYFLAPVNEYMIMLGYMFVSFGFSSLSSSSTNEVSRFLPRNLVSAGIGMKQQMHYIGSASGSVLAGILLEIGDASFTVSSFKLAFLILLLLMVISSSILYRYSKKIV
ncbi:MFS transporter [Pseudalkalibacillus caeni]|uniref:MFS transporter n=1 Tax=Exobacillus caeni TaxID=2574798 RepID=A0A5R9EXX8_9BACL|nr:MFS transporter [Pseudalkalibacillus caeni]TLS35036.1 MFS transporter [Pseudalkalibacillus caeni]